MRPPGQYKLWGTVQANRSARRRQKSPRSRDCGVTTAAVLCTLGRNGGDVDRRLVQIVALTGARRAGAGDDRAGRPVRRRRHRRQRRARRAARRGGARPDHARPRPGAARVARRATAIRPPSAPSSKPSSCRRGRRSTRPSRGSKSAFERVDGYFNALGRDLRRGLDLAIGPELPIDARLGAWDPSSHVTDDLFSTRIAFVVAAQLPAQHARPSGCATASSGAGGSGRRRASTGRFALRVPAAAQARLADARAAAEALHQRLQPARASPAHRATAGACSGRSCA